MSKTTLVVFGILALAAVALAAFPPHSPAVGTGTRLASANLDSDWDAPVKTSDGWSDEPGLNIDPDPKKAAAHESQEWQRLVESTKLIGTKLALPEYPRLSDGRFETGVVLDPNESLILPAPPNGTLLVSISDPNRLGQVGVEGMRLSLNSGWNRIPARTPVKMIFRVSEMEQGTSSHYVTIMEVRSTKSKQ